MSRLASIREFATRSMISVKSFVAWLRKGGMGAPLAEQDAVGAQDRAEDRDGRGSEQNEMGERDAPEDRSRVARRFRLKPPMRERLHDEDEAHEHRPDQRHGAEPPERRVGELRPE